MPPDCAADCRFCEFDNNCADIAASSSSSSLQGNNGSISSTAESTLVEASPEYAALDEAFGSMVVTSDILSKDDKEEEEEKEDLYTIIHSPSPSSVYSNASPLEQDNNTDGPRGSEDWSFLDDVHLSILAWLDAGGLEMARLGYAPVFTSGLGGKGMRRHSI